MPHNIMCMLFILKLRLVVRSVLFTLHPPDLRGGKSVLTRILSSSLHVLCANMMEM